MKTEFKLTAKNAVLINKYATNLQQSPESFLNRIVSDCMNQLDELDSDPNFFTSFGFRSHAVAERVRSWLADRLERHSRQFPWKTILETRIDRDPEDGLFYVSGSDNYNGMTFKF